MKITPARRRCDLTTILTPEGWSGATSGRWSRRADRVIDERFGVRTEGRDLIDARAGDDVIIGRTTNSDPGYFSDSGRLQMGRGDDLIIGSSRNGVGIRNKGFIFMGPGDDRIEASGGKLAMRNRRFIFMQEGDDVVDVSQGGIRGKGFIDMGPGNNTFIGFGEHDIIARRRGFTNTLLLPEGTYEVRRRGNSRAGRQVRIQQGDDTLRMFDFQQVGGIGSRPRDRIDIEFNGTLVVNSDGTLEVS